MSDQKVLFQKIARIMGRLDRMPKTGFNTHFKYHFVTDADVADTIRAELAAENIAFFASMVHAEQSGDHTLAEFEFTFACADSGETFTSRWFGESQDKQDKGVSKAATSAEKYFLLKTFMLSTGDKDDDPDNSAGSRVQPPQAPPRNDPPPTRTSAPAAPKRAPSAELYDHEGDGHGLNNDDPGSDFPRTIRDFWPDTASGLLSTKVADLPIPVGGVIYPVAVVKLKYENDDAVKNTLGLDSLTEFAGTLEALMLRVIELSPIENS